MPRSSAFGRTAVRRSTAAYCVSSSRDRFLNKLAIILFAHTRKLLEKSNDIPEVIIAEAWPGRQPDILMLMIQKSSACDQSFAELVSTGGCGYMPFASSPD